MVLACSQCFLLCAQQKRETEKANENNINTNKATKKFQGKISVEGVNE